MKRPLLVWLAVVQAGLGSALIAWGIVTAITTSTQGLMFVALAFMVGFSVAHNIANVTYANQLGGAGSSREDTDFEDLYLSQGDVVSSIHGTKIPSAFNDD